MITRQYNPHEYRRGDPRAKTMLKLSAEMADALFNCRAPNAKQASTLRPFGVNVRRHGWFKKLLTVEISEALYAELMDCKGRRPKCIPKKQWRKPCVPCE